MWRPNPRHRLAFLVALSLGLLFVPKLAVGAWLLRVNWETVITTSAVTYAITFVGLWGYAWLEELGGRDRYFYVDQSAVEKFLLLDRPDDE